MSEYVAEMVKRNSQYTTDICPHCRALHWIEEWVYRFSEYKSCCKRGNVKLDLLNPSPLLLEDLLTAIDLISRRYHKHSRQYNSALTFIFVNYCANT